VRPDAAVPAGEHAAFEHREELRQARNGIVAGCAYGRTGVVAEECMGAILDQDDAALIAQTAELRERDREAEEVRRQYCRTTLQPVLAQPQQVRLPRARDGVENRTRSHGLYWCDHRGAVVIGYEDAVAGADSGVQERQPDCAAAATGKEYAPSVRNATQGRR